MAKSGGNYELKATFSAENKATKTLENLSRQLTNLEKKIENLDKASASPTVTVTGNVKATEGIEDVDKALKKVDGKKATATLDADKKRLTETLNRSRKELDAWLKHPNQAELDLDPDKLERKLKTIQSSLNSATRKAYKYEVQAEAKNFPKLASQFKEMGELAEEHLEGVRTMFAKLKGERQMRESFEKIQKDVDLTELKLDNFSKKTYDPKLHLNDASFEADLKEDIARLTAESKRINTLRLRAVAENFPKVAQQAEALGEYVKKQLGDRIDIQAQLKGDKAVLKSFKDISSEADDTRIALREFAEQTYKPVIGADNEPLKREARESIDLLKAYSKRTFKLVLQAEQDGFPELAAQLKILGQVAKDEVDRRYEMLVGLGGEEKVSSGLAKLQQDFKSAIARPYEFQLEGDNRHAMEALRETGDNARRLAGRVAAFRIQVEGDVEAEKQIDDMHRQLLQVSEANYDARIKLQGIPTMLAGLVQIKRELNEVDGTYTIKIDVKDSLTRMQAFGTIASNVFTTFNNHLKSASPLMEAFARKVYAVQQVAFVFGRVLTAVGVAAAGPLVAGLTTVILSLGTFAAGLGLVVAAAVPMIRAFTEQKQRAQELKGAQEDLTSAQDSTRNASQQLTTATQNVGEAQRQGAEQVRSAIQSHKDAVRGVADARRSLGELNRGVQDAEVQGEEQVKDAVQAHKDAVLAIKDARASVAEATRAVQDAEIQGEQQIKDAINAHRDAVFAVKDARQTLAEAQRGVAQAEIEAEQSVADAIREHEDALRNVQTAQMDYKGAQYQATLSAKDFKYANMELNYALQTEKYRLQDLKYEIQGLGLDHKELAIDLAAARKDLAQAENTEERQRAALQIERIMLQQKELTSQTKQAQIELNKAQQLGTSELKTAQDARQSAFKQVLTDTRAVFDAREAMFAAEREAAQTSKAIDAARRESALQIAEAQRSVADAQRGVTEAIRAERQAHKEIGVARREAAAGVADAQRQVVEAQRGVTAAIRAEKEAHKEIGVARKDAARQVKDAQQQVVEGQRAVLEAMRAERQAEREIGAARREAAKAVKDAQVQQRLASKELKLMREQEAEAQTTLNNLMNEYSTRFNEAIAAVKHLGNIYTKEFKAAQERMNRMTAAAAFFASKAMPQMGRSANNVLRQIGNAFRIIRDDFKRFGVFKSFQNIMKSMPDITRNWTIAFGRFGGAFSNIMSQAIPFTRDFSKYIKRIARDFLGWTDSKDGRKEIKQFFESAAPVARELVRQIARIAGAILSWSTKHPGRVATAIRRVGDVIWAVGKFAVRVGRWLIEVFTAPKPKILRSEVGLLGDKFGLLGAILKPIKNLLFNFFTNSNVQWFIKQLALAYLAIRILRGPLKFIGYTLKITEQIAIVALRSMGVRFDGFGALIRNIAWNIIPQIGRAIRGLPGAVSAVVRFFGREFSTVFWGIVRAAGQIFGRGGSFLRVFAGGFKLLGFGVRAIFGPVGMLITAIITFGQEIFRHIIPVFKGLNELGYTWKDNFIEILWIVVRTVGGSIAKALGKALMSPLQLVFGIMARMPGHVGETGRRMNAEIDKNLNKYRNIISGDTAMAAKEASENTEKMKNNTTKDTGQMQAAMHKQFGDIANNATSKSKEARDNVSKNADSMKKNVTGSTDKMKIEGNADFEKFMREAMGKSNSMKENVSTNAKNMGTNVKGSVFDMGEKGKRHFADFNTKGTASAEGLKKEADNKMNFMQQKVGEHTENARRKGIEALINLENKGAEAMWKAQSKWVQSSFDASAGIQAALNNILEGLGRFIDKAGISMDKPQQFDIVGERPVMARPDVSHIPDAGSRGNYRGNVYNFATGGEHGPVGGIANGTTRVYGEVPGTKEFYITDNALYRKRNMEILQAANEHMMAKGGIQEAARATVSPGVSSRWKHYMGLSTRRKSDPNHEEKFATGGGWTPGVAGVNAEIERLFGVQGSTYAGHGRLGRADLSVDWTVNGWGGTATGAAKTKGDNIASHLQKNWDKNSTEYLIWWKQMSESQGKWAPYVGGGGYPAPTTPSGFHTDHVHYSSTAKWGGAESLSGGGGSAAPMVDYNKMFEDLVPTIPNVKKVGKVGDAMQMAASKVRKATKEFYVGKAPASTSGGGAGSWGGGGNLEQWIKEGFTVGNAWPNPSTSQLGAMKSRVMQESGGNPDAVNNWDSNAAKGTPSKGLVQIIKPTWEAHRQMYGADIGGFDSNWMNPIKSVAASTRYMKNQYGYVVGANGSGYSQGGMARGPHMGVVGEGKGRGELMWPIDDPRVTRIITQAVDKSRAPKSGPGEPHGGVVHRVGDGPTRQAYRSSNTVTQHQGQGSTANADAIIQRAKQESDKKIEQAMEKLGNRLESALKQVEYSDKQKEHMIEQGVKTALAAILSKAGGDAVDKQVGKKMDFDLSLGGLID